jgi:hypothetical protein
MTPTSILISSKSLQISMIKTKIGSAFIKTFSMISTIVIILQIFSLIFGEKFWQKASNLKEQRNH